MKPTDVPRVSVTEPVIAPESVRGVAAVKLHGPIAHAIRHAARYAGPMNGDATVLCAIALNIRVKHPDASPGREYTRLS